MHCTQCGTKLLENSNFCNICGKPIKQGIDRESPKSPQVASSSTDVFVTVQWEYAEITCTTSGGIGGDAVYIWLIKDGKIEQLKGFKGGNKVLKALSFMGEHGWELVSSLGRVGEDVWYLKRPKKS